MKKDLDAAMGVISAIIVDMCSVIMVFAIKAFGYEPEYVPFVVVLLASMTIGSIVHAILVHDEREEPKDNAA